MKTAAEIVARCFDGEAISPQNITGSAVRAYVISPYACFCHFHVDPNERDPTTRFGNLLRKWGQALEKKYTDALDPNLRKRELPYDRTGFEVFVDLALGRERYIYNPPLFFLGQGLAGRPDLLVRHDSAGSDFGDHHYRVEEIKLSSGFEEKSKRRYLLQAVFYNFLLGQVQGYLPTRFSMVDRHGNEKDWGCPLG